MTREMKGHMNLSKVLNPSLFFILTIEHSVDNAEIFVLRFISTNFSSFLAR
jgi:hypothetical protein